MAILRDYCSYRISEESQTSLMTADAEMIIYTDGASEMVCTYVFMGHIAVWIITVSNRLFTEPERLVINRYCCARTS